MNRLVMLLATWFGSGRSPVAPGTAGTAAAIPLYLLVSGLPLFLYLAFTVLFILFSIAVASRAEAILGCHDHGSLVIDEVAGFLVAMAGSHPSLITVMAGFFLFRLFDVVKPFPAGWIDRNLPGGAGVVLDDVAAGAYAGLVMHLLAGVI